MNEEDNKEQKKINKHVKPGNISAKLRFNPDTETDALDNEEPYYSIKHKNIDESMVSFEKKTVKCLQKLHFQSKLTKFVLGCIPSFDKKIAATKN